MDTAEREHVVQGRIFLKYAPDAFLESYLKLEADRVLPIEIKRPGPGMIEAFNNIAKPLLGYSQLKERDSRTLAGLFNLLLPGLLFGGVLSWQRCISKKRQLGGDHCQESVFNK